MPLLLLSAWVNEHLLLSQDENQPLLLKKPFPTCSFPKKHTLLSCEPGCCTEPAGTKCDPVPRRSSGHVLQSTASISSSTCLPPLLRLVHHQVQTAQYILSSLLTKQNMHIFFLDHFPEEHTWCRSPAPLGVLHPVLPVPAAPVYWCPSAPYSPSLASQAGDHSFCLFPMGRSLHMQPHEGCEPSLILTPIFNLCTEHQHHTKAQHCQRGCLQQAPRSQPLMLRKQEQRNPKQPPEPKFLIK